MDDSGLVLFVGDLTFQGEVVLFEAMKMETVKKKKRQIANWLRRNANSHARSSGYI